MFLSEGKVIFSERDNENITWGGTDSHVRVWEVAKRGDYEAENIKIIRKNRKGGHSHLQA